MARLRAKSSRAASGSPAWSNSTPSPCAVLAALRFQRPGQRGAQIVIVGLQPVQHSQLRRSVYLLAGPFGDLGVVLGVPAPRAVKVIVGRQAPAAAYCGDRQGRAWAWTGRSADTKKILSIYSAIA
jgi:hypothetical protein